MKHFPFGKYEENGRQTTVGAIPFGRPKQARRINLTATRQTSNSSVGSIHESPARTLRTNGTATCRNVRPNKPSPAGEGGPPNALRMAVDEVLRSIRTARTAGDAPALRWKNTAPTATGDRTQHIFNKNLFAEQIYRTSSLLPSLFLPPADADTRPPQHRNSPMENHIALPKAKQNRLFRDGFG